MLNICREIPIWGFEAILRDGEVVGYIRRGEYAYNLGSFIGQGWVKVPYIVNVENGILPIYFVLEFQIQSISILK